MGDCWMGFTQKKNQPTKKGEKYEQNRCKTIQVTGVKNMYVDRKDNNTKMKPKNGEEQSISKRAWNNTLSKNFYLDGASRN